MSAARSLYDRIRPQVGGGTADNPHKTSQTSHARAREEKEKEVLSLSNTYYPVKNPHVTNGTLPGQLCPHVKDQLLAEWYAANPKVTCARCFLEGRSLARIGSGAGRG